MNPSPPPPAAAPQETQLRFREPKSMVKWFALDALVAAINTCGNQLRILGDPVRVELLEKTSNQVGAMRDDVLREQVSGIVVAPAGSIPPPKG